MPLRPPFLRLLGFAALLSGCLAAPLDPALRSHAAPEPTSPESEQDEPLEPGQLLAGAAKVDITPLAGMPLGGHAIEGGTGYALWTRLWARAIYLEDAEGEPLVLVIADLWSMPAGMADEVVERVREDHGLTQLGRAQVLLAATHTHHSPSNYGSTYLYNRAASNTGGFDPELRGFLARNIARAIAEAVASKEPARIRHATTPVASVARNRSLPPFLDNPEAAGILAANEALPTCPDYPREVEGVDPCQAVDPTLTTLRIEGLDGRPVAIAAFFAAHPTAMQNYVHAYGGDFFGLATARAEAALSHATGEGLGDAVVALFNGPQGDISPNWTEQGRPSTLVLGERMGAALIDAAGLAPGSGPSGGQVLEGTIASAFARQDLAAQAVEPTPSTPAATTAARPLPGRSLLSGAEDGPTRYRPKTPEGQTVDRHRRPGQGPKKPVAPPALVRMLFPRGAVPTQVPLSIHHVGPLTVAGLPGEFTTTMGMRIRVALAQAYADANPDAPRPILVGLAGEYLSYFVTPQEYALQHYEGGSTLWGQYAGALIAQAYVRLARETPRVDGPLPHASAGPRTVEHRGPARRFALEPGAKTRRALRGLPEALREQLRIHEGPRASWTFTTAAPTWDGPTWPRFAVEVLGADGSEGWRTLRVGDSRRPLDERTEDFVIFPAAIDDETWTWTLWWLGGLVDEAALPEGAALRLRVDGPGGEHLCTGELGDGEAHTQPCASGYTPTVHPEDGLGVVPATPR